MVNTAHLIPLFPLLAFVVNIFVGRKLGAGSAWVSVLASAVSTVFAFISTYGLLHGAGSYSLFTWLTVNSIPLNFGVIVDPLTCMMLLVVTIVGTLIQIYSIGYMQGDSRYSRFFAFLSLFMASMLGLLLADNFLMLYVFWEGVGICSYFLISFWFERPAAARAGIKAFVTTRIGDTAFLIGIFILFFNSGTLSFHDLSNIQGSEGVLTLVAMLIFLGAVGKSAQFPLHVWLPDAMEGPTPVSALIHAATMVAAGVYLVARTYALFFVYPEALMAVAIIGAVSALMAASIATVSNDIKRVLAYSTISQLGLMMLSLGVGGYTAATFHLMTHAFFKALLFLCAGSIIHAVHTQDIQKMGGLFSKMKITGSAFLIGALAIAGVPPFSGFWSKDEILAEAWHNGHPLMFATALIVSFLTAFYMFRLIFLVLFGQARSNLNAHESPLTMTFPLVILSLFSVGIGLVGSPFLNYSFQQFISFESGGGNLLPEMDYFVSAMASGAGLLGIALAYLLYSKGRLVESGIAQGSGLWSGLRSVVINKYYFDELYDSVLVRPCLRISQGSFRFDNFVVDGAVNGVAWLVVQTSALLRRMQTGLVQNYLLIQVAGILVIIIALMVKI